VLKTLKKHKLFVSIKKWEFSKQSLVCLGYMIGGEELKIHLAKMELISKRPTPTNAIKVGSFVGILKCL